MILNFSSTHSPEYVYESLTNADKFVDVHPIIYKMDKIGKESYKVYEKVNFGFFPYRFTYLATIKGNPSEKTINIFATIKKITKVNMEFKITKSDTGCQIEEMITILTPLPIKNYLRKLFKEQHTLLFENIQNSI